MEFDRDLRARQEVRLLAQQAQLAFEGLQKLDQSGLDRITEALSRAGALHAAELAREACAKAGQALLILDEIAAAVGNGFVEEEQVLDFLEKRPQNLETVLTGRNPSARMAEAADYVSEILCRKHPFEQGTGARRGIEF